MSRNLFLPIGAAALSRMPLAACSYSETGEENTAQAPAPAPDAMASNDDPNAQLPPEDKPRPLMQAQVVLDRLGFTPGVIDGKMGMSTVNALKGFQEARGLPVTGELDQATQQALAQWQHIPATRVVTIPADFANDRFVQIPEEREDQAKLDRMGYSSLGEKIAECFHTTEEVLAELNAQPAAAPATPEAPQTNESSAETDEAAPKPRSEEHV